MKKNNNNDLFGRLVTERTRAPSSKKKKKENKTIDETQKHRTRRSLRLRAPRSCNCACVCVYIRYRAIRSEGDREIKKSKIMLWPKMAAGTGKYGRANPYVTGGYHRCDTSSSSSSLSCKSHAHTGRTYPHERATAIS